MGVLVLFMITLCVILLVTSVSAFGAASTSRVMARGKTGLAMEYIPDGLSKEQWAALKKKEEDERKKKGNLGVMGTNRFKSRSFEAWQKSGGKHLFPVDPRTTPYEERPYMQRKNGDWEGNDLAKKGYKGKGQGQKGKRLAIDAVYETAKKEGKLDSASILGGVPLPWTSKAAQQIGRKDETAVNVKPGSVTAGRQLSKRQLEAKKSKLVKISRKQEEAAPAAAAEKKKKGGFFGLF